MGKRLTSRRSEFRPDPKPPAAKPAAMDDTALLALVNRLRANRRAREELRRLIEEPELAADSALLRREDGPTLLVSIDSAIEALDSAIDDVGTGIEQG
jgi:hypothetical protein